MSHHGAVDWRLRAKPQSKLFYTQVVRWLLPIAWVILFSVGFSCELSAQSDWWQRAGETRTKYYNLKTDLQRDQAIEIANHLDRTFESYSALFSGLKLRRIARLDVYVFARQEDYLAILKQKFNDDGTGSGGKCITRGNVISLVAWKGGNSNARLKDVLQHEGFHQFASNFFPRLPTWANEGLAEVFERGVLIDGKIILGEVSRNDVLRLRQAKKQNRFRSVGDILTVKQSEWNNQLSTGNAGENYLQAWCLVHCFLYAEDAKYQKNFINFLKGINSGLEWKKSFVAAFGVPDFTSMDQVWLRYIDTLSPMDFEETIRRQAFLSAGYMQLRENSIHPMSLEQLETELNAIEFVWESDLFGEPRKLKASDKRLFQIPFAEGWKQKPVFELVDSKGRAPEASKKSSGTRPRTPKPLLIRTDGLIPQNFIVSWKRDSKSTGGYRPQFKTR